ADISENIRVLSIVGRFLEHSRIYYFRNCGEPDLYVGSADLMPRNIDRRVEVLFPVQDLLLRQEIVENILSVQLRDNARGYWLQKDGSYERGAALPSENDEGAEVLFSSQAWFLNGRTTLLQPQMPEVGD